eukprot:COSAG01_NODE_47565_length_389_cov_0.744828_1_plen_67_part_00
MATVAEAAVAEEEQEEEEEEVAGLAVDEGYAPGAGQWEGHDGQTGQARLTRLDANGTFIHVCQVHS